MVMKNINSRVRSNSLTPKEILFRRNVLSNKPIDVDDIAIKTTQHENRTKSSKSSQKHKAKFKAHTPPQSFSVGDLVMLRDSLSKNSPREIFIVEEIPKPGEKFILIRKLKESIRPRLYKSLPDELIHSPSTPHSSSCQVHLPHTKRKAAVEARQKIRSSLYSIRQNKVKFKHGWVEADQHDLDYTPPYSLLTFEEDPVDTSCDPTSISSRYTNSSIDSSDKESSNDDLIWDDAPDQVSLQSSIVITPTPTATSTPPQQGLPATLPPPFLRDRIPAFTRPPLTRQHAFRRPRSDQAFQQSPTDNLLPTPNAPTKKSRIPKPTNPNQVVLNLVNDISDIPYDHLIPPNPMEPVRRSSRSLRRPDYYGTASYTSTRRDRHNSNDGEEDEDARKKNNRPRQY